MADESLSKSWLEITDDIVVGSRRFSEQWLDWFAQTSGTFEQRVRKVFDERGHLPSPSQFNRVQNEMKKWETEIKEPKKKAEDSKKKAEEPPPEE